MIQDAVWTGLLLEQILEARLSEVVETAASTYLSALDSDEQPTAKLYVQKVAKASNEAWQSKQLKDCRGQASQTRPLHPSNTPAPPPKRRTAMTWTSQGPGRAVSVGRSSKRSFRDSLIGLVRPGRAVLVGRSSKRSFRDSLIGLVSGA